MSRYIDAEEAIKAIEDLPNAYNGWSDTYDKAYIIGTLEEVPSADVVERQKYEQIKGLYEQSLIDRESMAKELEATDIVRCKECKHAFINEHHSNRPLICGRTKMCGTTKEDWFCADGERRTDD